MLKRRKGRQEAYPAMAVRITSTYVGQWQITEAWEEVTRGRATAASFCNVDIFVISVEQ